MSEAQGTVLTEQPRRFRRYPEYKDSGVEWLGEIPKAWSWRRLKLLVAEALKYGANESAELIDPDLPRYVRITDVQENGKLRDDTFRSLPEKIAADYTLQDGDLLFARSGATVGKTFRYETSWGRCAYAGYLIRARLDSRKVESRFVKYYSESGNYWDWLKSSFIQATIQNVSAERYANLELPLPSLQEQRVIAAFLDRETSKLDALVAKKERLIELLQEKRTALITRAVTKGLNPNVPMKDSGVEWLGEIPAHWMAQPLSHLLSRITYGFTNPMPVADEGPYMLTALDVGDGRVLYDNARRTTEEAYLRDITAKSKPNAGDILITKDGTLGRVAIADDTRSCVNQSVAILGVRLGTNVDFIQNVLRSAPYQERMIFEAGGTAIKHIYITRLAKMFVVLPPVDEQRVICAFIGEHRQRLDGLLTRVLNAIAHLKELRSALISAAVTGKIDVREAAP